MWEQLQEWDTQFLIFLNNLGNSGFDPFWVFITKIEHWLPLYVLFFFLFLKTFPIRKAIFSILGTLIVLVASIGATEWAKATAERIRPNNVDLLNEQLRILQTPIDYSFFSGHAAVSMAVTVFVVLLLKKQYNWVSIFYIWPLLFGLSRLFVGVHYPGDIAVGGLVGLGIGYLGYRLFKQLEKN